jgi:hypothetical protein
MTPRELVRQIQADDIDSHQAFRMVQAVIALHAPSVDQPRICLRGCGQWPCPTIREMARVA